MGKYTSCCNRLGDEGVQPILKALMKNVTLISLDISSNDFGEPSASLMSEVMISILSLRLFYFSPKRC